MAAQEEERAKEHEENKPLMWVGNSNNEGVEEVSEQTTESTGLGASLATAASPAEDRTRKLEVSKPEASEADEGFMGESDGADADENLVDVAARVEKRGSEGGEIQETLPERLEIGIEESLTLKSGKPQSKYYLKLFLYIKYSRM